MREVNLKKRKKKIKNKNKKRREKIKRSDLVRLNVE